MKRAIALILALAVLACTTVFAEDQEPQIVMLDAPVQMYVHAVHGLNLRSEMDLDNDDNIQRVLLLNETVMVDYIVDGIWAHVIYVLPASEQVAEELETEIEAVAEEIEEAEANATAEPAATAELAATTEPTATAEPTAENEEAAEELEAELEEIEENAEAAAETEPAEEETADPNTIEGFMWLGYLGEKAYRPVVRKSTPAPSEAPDLPTDTEPAPSVAPDLPQPTDAEL